MIDSQANFLMMFLLRLGVEEGDQGSTALLYLKVAQENLQDFTPLFLNVKHYKLEY
jgi:hypothetical protein